MVLERLCHRQRQADLVPVIMQNSLHGHLVAEDGLDSLVQLIVGIYKRIPNEGHCCDKVLGLRPLPLQPRIMRVRGIRVAEG